MRCCKISSFLSVSTMIIQSARAVANTSKVFFTKINYNCQVLGLRRISTLRGRQVDEILNEIQDRDGLCKFTPHIQYLIGSSGDSHGGGIGDNGNSGGSGNTLDISDKTQLILQSSHPVRYIIEREIRALEYSTRLELKYLDWVTIFGRSLLNPKSRDSLPSSSSSLLRSHEDRLGKISTAAECGMFSADVHQTVVNISASFPPGRLRSQFNLGNKYAVLVGDFFAIKTIYFAEKVKSSPVFLEIIRGVEDFTYSSFAGALLDPDPEIAYPILPSASASRKDWINYNVKVSGYFTGGLKAAFTLNSLFEDSMVFGTTKTGGGGGIHMDIEDNDMGKRRSRNIRRENDQQVQDNLRSFVSNLALVLKIVGDLQEFKKEEETSNNISDEDDDDEDLNQMRTKNASPFLFITLPAILYQEKYPKVFHDFRNSSTSSYEYDSEKVREIRQKISEDSETIAESQEMLRKFAQTASHSFSNLGKDDYYSSVLQRLLSLATQQ